MAVVRVTGRVTTAVSKSIRPAIAFIMAVTCTVTVGMGVPAYAAEPIAEKTPAADPGRAITGTSPIAYRFTTPDDDAKQAYRASATTWPRAESMSLTLGEKPARQPGSPVWARSAGAGRADIRVLDRSIATGAGVSGVLLSAIGDAGRARIGLDYGSFAQAYGGNYGSRLRLVQLPACALTTPEAAACRARTPLVSTNDGTSKSVSAEVTLSARPTVLAALADPGNEGAEGGTYAASDLKPSGSWSGGGSTGSFTYSYPISLPGSPGGLAPAVGLSYDSGSLDGQTTSTQAQASWAGDGWSTPQSYIEQTYVSCNDEPQGKPAPEKTYDLCEAGPVLTLSLNGATSELIWDKNKSEWRPKKDSGETVKRSAGFDNGSGAKDTNFWTVTMRDGTRYQFGRNRLPGYTGADGQETNSVDTVPVYSPQEGDPCWKSSGFTDSYCLTVRRWNLDYVADVNGNAMAYYYGQDKNFYGRHKGDTMTEYVRDSYLKRIDYGFRDGAAYGIAPNQVVFGTGARCVATTCSPLNDSTKANWPDVPYDLACAKGAKCEQWSPSYYSTVRLTSIVTRQYDTGSKQHVPIDTYTLTQTLPATGDSQTPTLWLSSIKRTGHDFGVAGNGSVPDITLPEVKFTSTKLANRVKTDGYPSFYRHRIESVTTETGSVITAVYTRPEPCNSVSGLVPATNTKSCYPVRWTPAGATDPILDWFNKYAVERVLQTDPTGGSAGTSTAYSYLGGAAWHYDDNEVVKAKYRTYGQFRGYGRVQTFTGDGVNDKRTKSETLYYRGMSKNNNTTVVNVTDSLDGDHEDHDQFAGQVLETLAYQGDGGVVDNSTITAYWVSPATATRSRTGLSALTSNWVAPALVLEKQRVVSATGTTWRYRQTDNSYDANVSSATVGMLKHVYSHTVPADAKYDRCLSNTYTAIDDTAQIVGLISETETVAVACGGFTQRTPASVPFAFNSLTAPSTVSRPAQVVVKSRMYYDDQSWSDTFPQTGAPTKGLVTMVKQAKDYTGGAYTYQNLRRSHYDKYGREDYAYDGKGNIARTDYTENAVGLTTAAKTTNAAGHTTSNTVSPRRGLTLTATDINKVVATQHYDALGRSTAVWLNNRPPATAPANYKFGYQIANDKISATTTEKTLETNGAYERSVTLYDALLRPRQIQADTQAGGILVTDSFYDTRGGVRATYDGWWEPTATPTIGAPISVHDRDLPAPAQTFLTYDGLGRTVLTEKADSGVVKTRSYTVYGGDRTTTIPPLGGTVTTAVTDPMGRMTALQEYTARPTLNIPANTFTGSFTVTGGTSLTTTYGYDAQGNQNSVKDTKQNPWTSTYNLLGQLTNRKDPDAGESKDFKYDNNGNLLQSTDGRGKTLSYRYDDINRQTDSFTAKVEDQSDANRLTSVTYDNANNAKPGMAYATGRVTTSIAYSGQQAYKTQVDGFNVFGSSLGETVTIPGTDGLAGDYVFSRSYYDNTGLPKRDEYPLKGGLPKETVTYGYTPHDAVKSMSGLGGYLQDIGIDAYGRVNSSTVGWTTGSATVTNSWNPHNGRLDQRLVARSAGTVRNLDQQNYGYDEAGNITRQTSLRAVSNNIGESQCYAYDQLRRLTEAWTGTDNCATKPTPTNLTKIGNTIGGGTAYWTSWAFDDLGNRTSQIQRSLTGGADTTTNYKYDETGGNQPHTLTSASTSGGATSSSSFRYDAAGNMITRNAGNGAQTLTWNDAGKLGAVTNASGTSTSVYNADGSLLLQKDPGTTTLYLGSQQHVLNTSTSTVTGTRYYSLPGAGTAIRTGTGSNFTFAIADQQGTPNLYLNSTAQTPSWRMFTPYGGPRGATIQIPDNRGFLNKPQNAVTGLTSVGAREYDPQTGRFVSVDPVQDLTDPQQWNGYAYANNNPVSMSDPSGLYPIPTENDDRFRHDVVNGDGGGGGSGGNGKNNCDATCMLDQPAPDGGVGHNARVTQFNYQGSPQYTYRDALTLASQSESGYALVCTRTFNLSDEACNSSNPWRQPQPMTPEEGAKLMAGMAVALGGLALAIYAAPAVAVGVRGCMAAKVACGASLLDGEMTSAAYGNYLGSMTGAGIGATKIGGALKGAMKASGDDAVSGAAKVLLGACSFTPDTEVLMADGTRKKIKDVQVGDEVLATDPEAGETIGKLVTDLHNHLDDDLVDVVVRDETGATETIHTTGNHPFWAATTKAWTRADHLRPGENLLSDDGSAVSVRVVRKVPGRDRMLNLTVAQIHTYYVLAGNTPVLVHNCGEIPWTSGRVSSASRAIDQGATKINVGSRAEAEELFLGKFQGEGYRNASGFDGVGTKQYFGEKRGTYHWDDQVGVDGRVLGHGAGNVDGALPHLQVHTFDGPIVRIFWGG